MDSTDSKTKPKDYKPPQSVDELLKRYTYGERFFGETELDKVVYDFRNAKLRAVNFSGSWLSADFRGADLRDADFSRANVKACDFRGANLSGANFKKAFLDFADFGGANLEGTSFGGACIQSRELKENDLPL